MGLFTARLRVRIVAAGCPERGVEALDWRRAHGLSDRLDNRCDVTIEDGITEAEFRALVTAGWGVSYDTAGGGCVNRDWLEPKWSPMASYGHCATIEVTPAKSAVDLACEAMRACAREQKRDECGASKLEGEIARARARLDELGRERHALEVDIERLRGQLDAIDVADLAPEEG